MSSRPGYNESMVDPLSVNISLDNQMIDPDHPIHREPPTLKESALEKAKRRGPDVIRRETRKFCLEQAVAALPNVQGGTSVVDIAKEFEAYVMNPEIEVKK